MERQELETSGPAEDEQSITGALVELILVASETSEDLWEIGDRVDAVLRGDETALALTPAA